MLGSSCRYDLLDTALDSLLTPTAQRLGVGLINGSPLHMRVLTQNGAPDWHPAPRRVIEAVTPEPQLLASVLKMLEPVANVAWEESRPENYEPGTVKKRE